MDDEPQLIASTGVATTNSPSQWSGVPTSAWLSTYSLNFLFARALVGSSRFGLLASIRRAKMDNQLKSTSTVCTLVDI